MIKGLIPQERYNSLNNKLRARMKLTTQQPNILNEN